MSKLRLLGRVTSINVRKVLWAAAEIGVEFDREDWGKPERDPNVPEFLALNPNAQVPVIVDDGYVLWESNAIITYLARKHRSGLLPADPQGQGLVEQWLYWQLGELNPTWGYAVYALMRKNPAYTDEQRIADSIRNWTARMQILEAQLVKGGGFAANGRISIADIGLVLSSHRWFLTPFDKPELPAVTEHYERLKATEEGRKYLSGDTP